MTVPWGGERISYSYFAPTTPEELKAKRANVELWSEETLGQMGRFPDFCAGLAVGLLDAADSLAEPRFAENARRYHAHCASHDLCLTHALNDQFYDRSKRIAQQADPDLLVHVVKETSEGVVVRGMRGLATLAPISDEALVYPNRPRQPDEADYALAFAVPLNAPGLTIICRDLYAEHADPERLPLTARFDEVDATLVFDDVLVPWERVFTYRDPVQTVSLHGRINTWAAYSTLIRLSVRLELFTGVADMLTQWSGSAGDPVTQGRIGQMIADAEVLKACIGAAESSATVTTAGYLAPRVTAAHRLHGIEASDRAERLMQDVLTSSLILTGGASDLDATGLGPVVDRFFRNRAPDTRSHLRLLAVAADLVQSSLSGRNQLYERLQSGEPDALRRRVYTSSDRRPMAERALRFVRDPWPSREGRG
jgi:aromatic ring hydroxylase